MDHTSSRESSGLEVLVRRRLGFPEAEASSCLAKQSL